MAKKSSSYWKDRFEILENVSNKSGQDAYRQIEPAFDKAQMQIQKEIEAWYGRFAKNNEMTIQDARKLLTSQELKELKWDVQEYIKHGRQNQFTQEWIKELENASAKYHISRLEALQIRTQQAIEVAFGNELDEVDAMARKIYTENYYHSIFEIQKGFNVGWDIGQIDERKLDKIIAKPWTNDNKTFKDRIWSSKNQMVNDLHQQLTRTLVLGKAPDEAIEALTKYVDKDIKNKKYVAGRLVMTEQAYFHSVSQKEAFNDLDVEEFEIVATLDSHTSAICQDMDGQHFPMKEYEPGATAPPFHVFCRSVTVPYFNDEFSLGERAARDDKGNTYYVPSDMTYKDWKDMQFKGAKTYNNFDITENGKYSFLDADDIDDYSKKIEHDYCTQTLSLKEVNQIWDKKDGYVQSLSYDTINKYMRGLQPKLDNRNQQITINVMKRITNNNTLRHNLVGVRKVDTTYLSNVLGVDISGLTKMGVRTDGMGRSRRLPIFKDEESALSIVKQINTLVGTEKGVVKDMAFTSVSLCENLNYFTHYPVRFEIQMPDTTKGVLTSNCAESEFIIKNESSIEILGSKVYNDNGDNCIIIFGRIKQ